MVAALLGAAAGGNTRAGDVAAEYVEPASFDHALAVCRFFHGGRASQRANLRPDSPVLQECLRQRGWWADGTRTLDSQAGTR